MAKVKQIIAKAVPIIAKAPGVRSGFSETVHG
jgi:hypothetical protein